MRATRLSRVILVLLMALAPGFARAADIGGWDRTHWGMTSTEIATLYGSQATRLTAPLDFGPFYSDVVLRRGSFVGYDFTVYFQMNKETKRLAQVLLERRKQYATVAVWNDVVAALEKSFGAGGSNCDHHGSPEQGVPSILERVWVLPTTTVRASLLNFGGEPYYHGIGAPFRLLLRFDPTQKGATTCPRE